MFKTKTRLINTLGRVYYAFYLKGGRKNPKRKDIEENIYKTKYPDSLKSYQKLFSRLFIHINEKLTQKSYKKIIKILKEEDKLTEKKRRGYIKCWRLMEKYYGGYSSE